MGASPSSIEILVYNYGTKIIETYKVISLKSGKEYEVKVINIHKNGVELYMMTSFSLLKDKCGNWISLKSKLRDKL